VIARGKNGVGFRDEESAVSKNSRTHESMTSARQPLIPVGNMLNQSSLPRREDNLRRAIKSGIAE
jgi:hypothetical protein